MGKLALIERMFGGNLFGKWAGRFDGNEEKVEKSVWEWKSLENVVKFKVEGVQEVKLLKNRIQRSIEIQNLFQRGQNYAESFCEEVYRAKSCLIAFHQKT
jgi:hypothetical protein